MAITGGPEAAENAVAAALGTGGANLIATLEALWADAGDVSSCPKPYDPAGTLNVQVGQTQLLADFPVINIYARTGVNLTNAAPRWGEWAHTVYVSFLVEGDSDQTIDRQAKRFLWGIIQTIAEHLQFAIAGYSGVTFNSYDAGAPGDQLQQEGRIVLSVMVDESL